MEESKDKTITRGNGFHMKLVEEYLTVLNLSNRNIKTIDDNLKLPINLTVLNLSHNELSEVPSSVLNLGNIKVLDLSHNAIQYFDDTPKFSQSIQRLQISHNDLLSPPYWIWSESCSNLAEINLSCNTNITRYLNNDEYYEDLLQYKSLVTNITIDNCKLDNFIEIIGTFNKAKSLVLGTTESSYYSLNDIGEVPCNGLNQCCDLEYLNLINTNIYYVNSNISIFKSLKEINLSHNKLDSLPEEFCSLENLEICIISYNHLLSLPDNFCNLIKLTNLSLDSNELCASPYSICNLPHIKRIDLYNNYLYEVPEGIENILEIDLAMNYFDEPTNEEYLKKKQLLRRCANHRFDGRKAEDTSDIYEDTSDIEHTKDETDDELLLTTKTDNQDMQDRPLSSPEDWDSDNHWIPHLPRYSTSPPISRWVLYVKRKMKEGNFCPVDAHPIPIAAKVRYEKMRYPPLEYESDGQFDDFSGDDS